MYIKLDMQVKYFTEVVNIVFLYLTKMSKNVRYIVHSTQSYRHIEITDTLFMFAIFFNY